MRVFGHGFALLAELVYDNNGLSSNQV